MKVQLVRATSILKTPTIALIIISIFGLASCAKKGEASLESSSETSEVSRGIRYGTPAKAGEFTSVVEVQTANQHGGTMYCSGTAISDRLVLTAAHCIYAQSDVLKVTKPSEIKVMTRLKNESVNDPRTFYEVLNFRVHREYSAMLLERMYNNMPYSYGNPDIAILQLKEPLVGVIPSRLSSSVPRIGDTLTSVGYGETGNGYGIKTHGSTIARGFLPSLTAKGEVLSASGSLAIEQGNSRQIICPGDSGGPSFNAQNEIVGVTQSVYILGFSETLSQSCQNVQTGTLTSVVANQIWIAETIDELNKQINFQWQNKGTPYDVNNDGFVTPLDAELVIHRLNRRAKDDNNDGEIDAEEEARTKKFPSLHDGGTYFFDVLGDGQASPIDLLLVINYLNRVNGLTSEVTETRGEEVGIKVKSNLSDARRKSAYFAAITESLSTAWQIINQKNSPKNPTAMKITASSSKVNGKYILLGAGNRSATYKHRLDAGKRALYTTWVKSTYGARNTPFTITYTEVKNGIKEEKKIVVYVNQRDSVAPAPRADGSRLVKLHEFNLEQPTNVTVKISDLGVKTNDVIYADDIKFEKIP